MATGQWTTADLPASVRPGLKRFCEQLQKLLGDQLVSIVLYGGLAEEASLSESCDVHVMVVLKEVTVELLDRIAMPVQRGRREFRLVVLLLSEDDIHRSTDVFPVKFLHMQRNHHMLYGKQLLSKLQIRRDHLQLRCEQEIKNLMIRLHESYLQRAPFSEQVESTLKHAYSSFARSLAVLIELKTGNVPASMDAAIEAAEGLGLNSEPLRKTLALRRGEFLPGRDELKQLYDSFMQTVRQAAKMVDEA